ncbi:hypothetical protein A6U96_18320 [Agrobacterium tumefaciens]|nr:hypothetical protein A6U96_18320 [Agrobacterium tumefaciens]
MAPRRFDFFQNARKGFFTGNGRARVIHTFLDFPTQQLLAQIRVVLKFDKYLHRHGDSFGRAVKVALFNTGQNPRRNIRR